MFQHILLPTDGSDCSQRAIEQGLAMARQLGARVTACYALPQIAWVSMSGNTLDEASALFEQQARTNGEAALAQFRTAAEAASVPFETVMAPAERPYQLVLATARERGCDLIIMGSHGRQGLEGMLIGSQTRSVLTLGKTTVLVVR